MEKRNLTCTFCLTIGSLPTFLLLVSSWFPVATPTVPGVTLGLIALTVRSDPGLQCLNGSWSLKARPLTFKAWDFRWVISSGVCSQVGLPICRKVNRCWKVQYKWIKQIHSQHSVGYTLLCTDGELVALQMLLDSSSDQPQGRWDLFSGGPKGPHPCSRMTKKQKLPNVNYVACFLRGCVDVWVRRSNIG